MVTSSSHTHSLQLQETIHRCGSKRVSLQEDEEHDTIDDHDPRRIVYRNSLQETIHRCGSLTICDLGLWCGQRCRDLACAVLHNLPSPFYQQRVLYRDHHSYQIVAWAKTYRTQ